MSERHRAAEVLLIGDSVLNGLAQPYSTEAFAVLSARHPFILDTAGCRRLITSSCQVGSSPPPTNAMTVLTERAGQYDRALVIGAGYNDTTHGAVGIAAAVDRILGEARRQGIARVVWLTYREAGDSSHVAQYRGHNDVLRAKGAEHPDLVLADWAERSRSLPSSWFSEDGLHLGASSATVMAALVVDALDAELSPGSDRSGLLVHPLTPVPPLNDALLTVLVPARNAEHLLPGWLDSIEKYADAVLALDDGSTDSTRTILEQDPVVKAVLSNPVRDTYHGWDDLGNRQRLVDAAVSAGARWLLFLDADERIDEADGRALRRFLETDARSGFAYGFEVFRMVDDEHHFDPRSLWVFRLFSAIDAVVPLGSQRLHFVPVPSGIPRKRWLFTSVRIQHSGSLTAAHRQARFEKYREADPGNDFQGDYSELLSDPEVLAPWSPRPPQLPVLLGVDGRYADLAGESDEVSPAMTAVVIAQDDETVIQRSVEALLRQELDDAFEVIVVCSGSDGTFKKVQSTYPTVRCVQLPDRALPGEARNAGLWMANGEFVTFPGSHVWLLPGSLQARLDAHDAGWNLVTGSVANGNTTRAGWASYLLDHAAQVPARASGEFQGVPGHASYNTGDVWAVGGFPEDVRAGEDTVVNRKLFYAGKRTYFCAEASFAHASPSTTAAHLLRHHFQRGRALGRIIRSSNNRSTLARLRSSLSLPKRRLHYITSALDHADDQLRARYRSVRPLVVAGAVAAGTGTWFQLIAGDKGEGARPVRARASETTSPILALSGRPGEAATGLLSAGSAVQSADRLMTFTRYARSVCPVRPALAPIVTSATLTAEHVGTYTIDVPQGIVDTYLRAVRKVGASLLLQVQPGAASLASVLTRWKDVLAEPDVGIFLDLRDEVAFARQRDEFDDAVGIVRDINGDNTIVLVRGIDATKSNAIIVPGIIDLRRRGGLFPHDALAADPGVEVLVYQ